MASADATLQIVWVFGHKGKARAWALPYDGQFGGVEGDAIEAAYDSARAQAWTAG
ncbi:hypothetical protein [Methylobacterium nodulans]|uniref:Uncharacterized protein n=1 Tax=Methylobacterium nodulans (strain LMG 21967 / CNCM I-2342 / ORS 2060) TaxID=460265 RepID=B8IQI2_METNO|nr:hypothetical protein [Methylobacterium nodulans]ACL60494.1 hypothetical protein Mnod_5655 [Methylobacterium nodulans ORS 2060]